MRGATDERRRLGCTWYVIMDLKITPSGQTIVKPTALGPGANTDTKLLIYGLFQKGRVLAQDGVSQNVGSNYEYKTKLSIVRRIRIGVLQRDGTPQASGLCRSTFLDKPANSHSVAQTAQTLIMMAGMSRRMLNLG